MCARTPRVCMRLTPGEAMLFVCCVVWVCVRVCAVLCCVSVCLFVSVSVAASATRGAETKQRNNNTHTHTWRDREGTLGSLLRPLLVVLLFVCCACCVVGRRAELRMERAAKHNNTRNKRGKESWSEHAHARTLTRSPVSASDCVSALFLSFSVLPSRLVLLSSHLPGCVISVHSLGKKPNDSRHACRQQAASEMYW